MNDRVVRQRYSSIDRTNSIIRAIAKLTIEDNRTATMTSIARQLCLKPSSYLIRKLHVLSENGAITKTELTSPSGITMYKWDIIIYFLTMYQVSPRR